MYGLGSLLSNVGTAAIAPALSTATMSATSDALKDMDWSWLTDNDKVKNFLSDAAGGTLGTALSMGMGAGLGAITDGSAGAAGGALTGLISGAGAAAQHDKFREAMGLTGEPETVKGMPVEDIQAIGAYGKPGVIAGSEPLSGVSTAPADITAQLSKQNAAMAPVAKSPILEKDRPSYFGLASELGMAGMPLGMGLTAAMQEGQAARTYDEEQRRKKAAEKADIAALVNRLYGRAYASGGFTVSNPTNPPTTIKFPEWFVEEFAQSGGLQSLAHGGYINTMPFDPDMAYPQSQIPRAAPYAAASPIRNEVLDFADGGLLEGEGDGMSDDIPANIDGKEKVRVADGEFVVPRDIAEQFGADKLEGMLNAVRKAAHAKKGKQIQQNAGKRAFIRTLSGVKA